jgi:Uma2 family endonuclease
MCAQKLRQGRRRSSSFIEKQAHTCQVCTVQHDDATMSRMSATERVDPGSGVKLTYDDYVLFPDDGLRHEIIDGEHYVTASPNRKHQAVSGNLYWLIRSWLETRPVGRIFYAPFDVLMSEFDIVVPDLLYISHERAADILIPKHVRGAPDLVIEVGSPSTRRRDETIKRRLYERTGVSEYWFVDPETDVVRVYRRQRERFTRATELSRDNSDVLTTPMMPGLELPLDRIFAE